MVKQGDKHFNISWLESFRTLFHKVIPFKWMRVIVLITVGLGVPIVVIHSALTGRWLWWGISCAAFYFIVVALSMLDSYVGKKAGKS